MNYKILATKEAIEKTIKALGERGTEAFMVENSAQALEKIKELIPAGVSVMNGSSRTLEQVGFVDYLKEGKHGWNNLHEAILTEPDKAKQGELRKQAVLSDFYLGSVHALCESGEFIIASNSGSQLSHVVFTSPNLIFVVGAQKITANLDAGMQRLHDYVIPLEDERLMKQYNAHTYPSKVVIFNKEQPFSGRKVKMIIVSEVLGF